MKVISTIENYQATEGCSLTIGTFDGVHIGHREIIDRLVKSAREKNHLAVVLTFFPHPRMVLQKDTSIRLIDTLKEKQQLLSDLGVDVVVIHPFSKEFSRLTATEFTRDILVNTFNISKVIIGYDHRFGKNRDASIKATHIQYGPLNVSEPGSYWKDIAKYWNTTEEAAKGTNCSNCVAFDISPRMEECMPGVTSDEDGKLGYCWMHHFKCHSARSCRTWAKGGPIEKDKISLDWQERNKK